MPFKVIRSPFITNKFQLQKENGTIINKMYNSEASAIASAKNFMRYRGENNVIVKGNKILPKEKKIKPNKKK